MEQEPVILPREGNWMDRITTLPHRKLPWRKTGAFVVHTWAICVSHCKGEGSLERSDNLAKVTELTGFGIGFLSPALHGLNGCLFIMAFVKHLSVFWEVLLSISKCFLPELKAHWLKRNSQGRLSNYFLLKPKCALSPHCVLSSEVLPKNKFSGLLLSVFTTVTSFSGFAGWTCFQWSC